MIPRAAARIRGQAAHRGKNFDNGHPRAERPGNIIEQKTMPTQMSLKLAGIDGMPLC
jgi:hypothetical protein